MNQPILITELTTLIIPFFLALTMAQSILAVKMV